MEIGVALQHHTAVGIVLGQHVGAGAYRVPVERQVLLGHAGLAVKTVCLARHRSKKGHRQPVEKLRILAVHPDAIRVAVDPRDAVERKRVEIQPLGGAPHFHRILQRCPEFLQPDNALRHRAENRRVQAWVCQSLDFVDVVVGGQFARPRALEISNLLDAAQCVAIQVGVVRLAAFVDGKGRMRLVADAWPDADFVVAEGDHLGRRIVQQFLARRVVIARDGDGLRRRWNQRVGTLQIVVLQRRLVDLPVEDVLILAIGAHGIKMLRTLGECRVQDILPALARRIRVVLLAAACGQQK